MNQPRRSGLIEGEEHAFHFAPAAEVDDVSEVAASAGAAARFGDGVFAEMGKQFRRLGKRAAARGMYIVTQVEPPGSVLRAPSSGQAVAKLLRCGGENGVHQKKQG